MTFKKLFFYLQNPKDFAFRLLARSAKWFRDDKKYINLKWWVVNFYGHEKIDWDNPTTFNEKLNWLKRKIDWLDPFIDYEDELLTEEDKQNLVFPESENDYHRTSYSSYNSYSAMAPRFTFWNNPFRRR